MVTANLNKYIKVNWHTYAQNSDSVRLHSCFNFLFLTFNFLNISMMTQTIIGFALNSLEILARMRERGSQSGWSGDHPWPSKSTTAYHIWTLLLSKPIILFSKPYRWWKFPTTLSLKVVGNGIQFPWIGVPLGSISVSKS